MQPSGDEDPYSPIKGTIEGTIKGTIKANGDL